MDQSGLAFITIKEARNLSITELTDVYCMLSLEGQIIKTSTCKVAPGFSGEWFSEGYTFDTVSDAVSFSVAVWGVSSSFPTGKRLGEITVPISEKGDDRWVNLTLDSQSTPAELHFKANCSPKNGKKVGFDDFVMMKFIGKGTFGKVMLVKKKDTGRLYAMKVMRKDKLYREAAITLPLTERDVLKKYNHPYVVHLKYAFQTETHLYMVMDYLSGGDLFDLMAKRNTLDEDTVRFYAAQIVLAISFLHEHDIIYRDLKPENLLIDMNGNMCLVDFGLCKEGILGDSVTHTFCGSLQYMAPEVIKGEGYGKSVDWWALGVMIYEMLTGVHPFMKSRNSTEKEVIHSIVHDPPQFSARFQCLSKSVIKLLQSLLQKEPTKRLGAGANGNEEIKSHPFFLDIDWKKLAKKEVLPPFKPHVNDNAMMEKKDPWAMTDSGGSPSFEILNDDEQEYFQNFSYVAPTELGRSKSSPAVRYLQLNERGSGTLILSSSPKDSPRRRMVKSPAFSGLSNMSEMVEEDVDQESTVQFNGSLRRARRRWSLSNFHVDGEANNEDTADKAPENHEEEEVQNKEGEIKKKTKSRNFLKSLFGKNKQ